MKPSEETNVGKIILPYDKVVVHPLVLLSTVDHYNRVAKDTRKRVVGVLLGSIQRKVVDVTNSYAVPFEEDERQNLWFFDHNYHENMLAMFKKVNAKENVVGWYSSGPKMRSADIEINELMRKYIPNPVMVIIEVQPKQLDTLDIPTKAYLAFEETKENPKDNQGFNRMTFQYIPSFVGAFEAEEVGVEHLLRDIKDTTISTTAQHIGFKMTSLKALAKNIRVMAEYLGRVIDGKLTPNQKIMKIIQNVFNLAPKIDPLAFGTSLAEQTNDMYLIIYISSLVRSVIALHNLILNKIEYCEQEKKNTL